MNIFKGKKKTEQKSVSIDQIDKVTAFCEKVTDGDIDARMTVSEGQSTAEIKLFNSINGMLDKIATVNALNESAYTFSGETIEKFLNVFKNVSKGNFEARILDVPEQEGIERVLSDSINEMIDRTDAYIRESTACLDFISRNMYHRRIAEHGNARKHGWCCKEINSAADSVEIKNQQVSRTG